MAMGGLELCRERGIAVPGDLALMGFDDIRMAAPLNLPTMKQFIPAKARAVTDHLIRCRDDLFPGSHAEEYPGELTMTPVLVERLTT
jgi:DNA-binding LacI/PurR family transcriptional regulator